MNRDEDIASRAVVALANADEELFWSLEHELGDKSRLFDALYNDTSWIAKVADSELWLDELSPLANGCRACKTSGGCAWHELICAEQALEHLRRDEREIAWQWADERWESRFEETLEVWPEVYVRIADVYAVGNPEDAFSQLCTAAELCSLLNGSGSECPFGVHLSSASVGAIESWWNAGGRDEHDDDALGIAWWTHVSRHFSGDTEDRWKESFLWATAEALSEAGHTLSANEAFHALDPDGFDDRDMARGKLLMAKIRKNLATQTRQAQPQPTTSDAERRELAGLGATLPLFRCRACEITAHVRTTIASPPPRCGHCGQQLEPFQQENLKEVAPSDLHAAAHIAGASGSGGTHALSEPQLASSNEQEQRRHLKAAFFNERATKSSTVECPQCETKNRVPSRPGRAFCGSCGVRLLVSDQDRRELAEQQDQHRRRAVEPMAGIDEGSQSAVRLASFGSSAKRPSGTTATPADNATDFILFMLKISVAVGLLYAILVFTTEGDLGNALKVVLVGPFLAVVAVAYLAAMLGLAKVLNTRVGMIVLGIMLLILFAAREETAHQPRPECSSIQERFGGC